MQSQSDPKISDCKSASLQAPSSHKEEGENATSTHIHPKKTKESSLVDPHREAKEMNKKLNLLLDLLGVIPRKHTLRQILVVKVEPLRPAA